MPGTKELKRRIKSIGSTKKITRAMQMVSAVKMRKAQSAALSSRSYSELAAQIISNLSDKVDPKYNALLSQTSNSKKIGIILITSNRGLVGAFNTNLVTALNKYLQENNYNAEVVAEMVAVGRKGREAMLRLGKTIFAEFEKADRQVRLSEILPISELITKEYLAGTYSKIIIAYNRFVSTITQKPSIKQVLPIQPDKKEHLPDQDKKYTYEYLFEPNPEDVLNYLVPRIIESQIYQAVLESDASEHSARMIMMKNATDAANELITDLTLSFNQLRQSNITKELSEITAGRIALE